MLIDRGSHADLHILRLPRPRLRSSKPRSQRASPPRQYQQNAAPRSLRLFPRSTLPRLPSLPPIRLPDSSSFDAGSDSAAVTRRMQHEHSRMEKAVGTENGSGGSVEFGAGSVDSSLSLSLSR